MLRSQRRKKERKRRRIKRTLKRNKLLWWFCVMTLLGFIVLGFSPASPHNLDAIASKGLLTIVTRNAPTTYYESREGLVGMEYDMAKSFAKFLGVKAKFIVRDSVNDVITDLHSGKADVAAAGLTLTPGRANSFIFGPSYQRVQQQVVCLRGGKRPRSVKDLRKVKLTVTANSSYEEQLNILSRQYTKLKWNVTYDLDAEQLLEKVAKKRLDCTIVDSNIMAINRRYSPELVVAFNLTEPEELAWVLPEEAQDLHYVLQIWFRDFIDSGKLAKLKQRYYGHIEFNYIDTRTFTERIESDLPRFKKLFMQAEKKHRMSWTLLAALAYQESHWKVKAKSPTGVRGIMMLTRITARELGVKNRLDPKQSIFGGAKYLAGLHKRLPKEIKEPERTWIAMAAYNVGLGHVLDAMGLARRKGLDPYVWSELAQVLPLLTQKKYFKTLKHGYARGREPVNYVNNIRDYKDILEQHILTITSNITDGSSS